MNAADWIHQRRPAAEQKVAATLAGRDFETHAKKLDVLEKEGHSTLLLLDVEPVRPHRIVVLGSMLTRLKTGARLPANTASVRGDYELSVIADMVGGKTGGIHRQTALASRSLVNVKNTEQELVHFDRRLTRGLDETEQHVGVNSALHVESAKFTLEHSIACRVVGLIGIVCLDNKIYSWQNVGKAESLSSLRRPPTIQVVALHSREFESCVASAFGRHGVPQPICEMFATTAFFFFVNTLQATICRENLPWSRPPLGAVLHVDAVASFQPALATPGKELE